MKSKLQVSAGERIKFSDSINKAILTCLKLNNILDFYLGSIIYKVIFVTDYDGEDRRNLVKMIIYI